MPQRAPGQSSLPRQLLKTALGKLGYRVEPLPSDIPNLLRQNLPTYRSRTMVSLESLISLHDGLRHCLQNGIEGSIVQCGVWRGGTARFLLDALATNDADRDVYLYDTFEGMTEPGPEDLHVRSGEAAKAFWERFVTRQEAWLAASLEDVHDYLGRGRYPDNKVHLIKGKVEDTLSQVCPDKIALLHLDTDWYESTYHELTFLYPRVPTGGIVVIDDYGTWSGVRSAVDEYFDAQPRKPFLARIDSSSRILVKPSSD